MYVLSYHTQRANFYEKLYICRTVDKFYTNFNVIAKYFTSFTKVQLEHALRKLILKNPVLAMNFFRDIPNKNSDRELGGSNFYKKPLDKIKANDVLFIFKEEQPIDNEFLKSLNDIEFHIDAQKPLWSLQVYYYNGHQYLVYLTDHVMVDGTCGTAFHEDLLHELVNLDDNLLPLNTIFNYSKDKLALCPLPPTSDKFGSTMKPPIFFAAKIVLQTYVLSKRANKWFHRLADRKYPDTDKYPIFNYKPAYLQEETFFSMSNISPTDVATILRFLRSKNLTMTPYLSAIATQTMQQYIFPLVSKQIYSSIIDIAVNGRSFYPQHKSDLRYSFFVSIVEPVLGQLKLDRRFSSIQEETEYISKSIHKGVDEGKAFWYLGMLRYINSWKFVHKYIGRTDARSTINVSNLGNVSINEGGIAVEDLIFSQDLGLSSHIGLSTVSTPTGGLNIVFNYFHYINDLEFEGKLAIDIFTQEFTKRIVEYADPD